MPKITLAVGPTIAGPDDGLEVEGVASSPDGSISSASSSPSGSSPTPRRPGPGSPAHSAGNRSSKGRPGNVTAGTTGGRPPDPRGVV